MAEFIEFLNQPLPVGIIILIGMAVLWFKVSDLRVDIDGLKATCEERLKWCINHFEPKP